MLYQRLPTHFVANQSLCEFLLAQGCTEHPLQVAQRYFISEHKQAFIVVDMAASRIELVADNTRDNPWLCEARTTVSAAALLFVLTADSSKPDLAEIFDALTTALPTP